MNYSSDLKVLGLPLLHITFGGMVDGHYKRGIAKGWIAIGDISFGVLFSLGGVAVWGVAFGGVSAGLLSLGGMAIGGLALGGCAFGILAVGGAAIGAYSALGGLAVAFEFARGGAAIAHHANDSLAATYFDNSLFYVLAQTLLRYSRWLVVLAFLPVLLNLWKKKRTK